MSEEMWRPLLLTPLYEVSDLGRIRSLCPKSVKRFKGKESIIVGQHGRRTSYLSVGIFYNGKKITRWVHRLVWESFNGPIKNGLHVNHIDLNTKNNKLSNLELLTQAENNRHAAISGAMRKRSAHLTDIDITVIRKSERSQKRLARMFCVPVGTVKSIKNRKCFKYVEDVPL